MSVRPTRGDSVSVPRRTITFTSGERSIPRIGGGISVMAVVSGPGKPSQAGGVGVKDGASVCGSWEGSISWVVVMVGAAELEFDVISF